jgi:hypothetical protein
MPPIEDQRRSSVTYAKTSAFSELDHQLIGHPKSQRGTAAHKPTLMRSLTRAGRTTQRLGLAGRCDGWVAARGVDCDLGVPAREELECLSGGVSPSGARYTRRV